MGEINNKAIYIKEIKPSIKHTLICVDSMKSHVFIMFRSSTFRTGSFSYIAITSVHTTSGPQATNFRLLGRIRNLDSPALPKCTTKRKRDLTLCNTPNFITLNLELL